MKKNSPLRAPGASAGQLRRKMLVAVVAACFGAAQANPVAPQVVAGQASFSQQGNLFSITNTPNTIINWQSFSVGANDITRFIQQNSDSKVLNRITGQDPSQILGALQSNGKVFLINPNGVLFGAGSRVDVNGLVASSLALSDADFLAGKQNFAAGINAGKVANQGTITTPNGGQVFLIAPNVENSGVITSPNGQILLAAGHSVQLVDSANPDVQVIVSAPADQALNLGGIVAQGGRVGIYGALVNQRGRISADSAVRGDAGQILLKSSGTTLLEAGSVTSAAGSGNGGSGGKGGNIELLGPQVGLTGNAVVDASGNAGGGTVLLGGDAQGKNAAVMNAQQSYVGADSVIKADALASGNGGKVIVWSDDATRMYGRISARGGAAGGDGGYVETSGHYLDLLGTVDTRAPRGKAGTLLLDPTDIDIVIDPVEVSSAVEVLPVLGIFQQVLPASESALRVSVLQNQLALGDVQILTANVLGSGGGLITVRDPVAWTSNSQLSLLADSGIAINAAVTGSGAGAALTLTSTTGAITQTAPITVATLNATTHGAAGAITLTNTGNAIGTASLSNSVANGNPAGGNIALVNHGALTLAAASANAGSLSVTVNNGDLTVGGVAESLDATDNVVFNASGAITLGTAAAVGSHGSGAISMTGASIGSAGASTIQSSTGGVALNATGGDLTLGGLVKTFGGPLALSSSGNTNINNNMQLGTGNFSAVTGGGGTISFGSGGYLTGGDDGGTTLPTWRLFTDNLVLDHAGALNAAGVAGTDHATVRIGTVTAGRAIDLGTRSAGKLGLTNADLNDISATSVVIGNTNSDLGAITSGAITVSAPLTTTGLQNLALNNTSGGVAINHALPSVAGNLGVNTGGSITVGDAVNAGGVLTFHAQQAITSTAGGTLTAAGVQLSATNGDLILGAAVAGSGLDMAFTSGGAIAVNAPVSGQDNLTLSAVNDITQSGAGLIGGNALRAQSSNGAVTLNSANTATGIAGYSSRGDFQYTAANDSTALTIGDSLSAHGPGNSGAAIRLTAGDGGIAETGSTTLNAHLLALDTTGNIGLSQSSSSHQIDALTAVHFSSLSYEQAQALTLGDGGVGVTKAAGVEHNVGVTLDSGTLTVAENVSSALGGLTLSAPSIQVNNHVTLDGAQTSLTATQAHTGSIALASHAIVNGSDSVFLRADNMAVHSNATISAGVVNNPGSGTVTLQSFGDSVGIMLGHNVDTSNSSYLGLTDTTLQNISAGNLVIGATSGGVGDITVAGALNLGSGTFGGNLSLLTSGTVAINAPLTAPGTLALQGGSIVNNNALSGTQVTLTGADLQLESGGAITATGGGGSGTVTLNASSGVGAVPVELGTSTASCSGAVCLSQTALNHVVADQLVVHTDGGLSVTAQLNLAQSATLSAGSGHAITVGHSLHDAAALTLAGDTITVSAPVSSTGALALTAGAITVNSGGPLSSAGTVTLTGDTITLADTVTGALAQLTVYTPQNTISIGGGADTGCVANCLRLDALQLVNAPTIVIGDIVNAGAIHVAAGGLNVSGSAGNLNAAVGQLGLLSGGGVTQSGAIVVPSLAISAGDSVLLANAANHVGTLAAVQNAGGAHDFTFANTGDLAVARVTSGESGGPLLDVNGIGFGHNVSLATTGALTSSGGAVITASGLTLQTTGGIGSTAPLLTSVVSLTATNTSDGAAPIYIQNVDQQVNGANQPLQVVQVQQVHANTGMVNGGLIHLDNTGEMDVTGTVGSENGAITLQTHSPLTVAATGVIVSSGTGDISLSAGPGGTNDVLTLLPGASIQSNGGNVTLTAGAAIVGNPASVVQFGGVGPHGTLTLRGNQNPGNPPPPPPPPPGPTLDQCVANPALAGCSAVLPTLAVCVANPSAAGCSVVLPTLAVCVANPSAAGCSAVLPTLAVCVANPSAAGCSTVLPTLAVCVANPSAAGCSAVLPTLAVCVANPSAAGCSAVLPTLAVCAANPSAPGCFAVLPTLAVCVANPTAAGCSAVLPTLAVCVATPSTAGCSAVLPTLAACSANPSAPGCSTILPTLAVCVANPTAAGCSAVLPTLSACTINPSAPGCSAVLPTLAVCVANPTAAGCSIVLPTLAACSANPSVPGCSAVLPTLTACSANPSAPGCSAVLPSLAICTAAPTTAGCSAVLPSLASCVANPAASGCALVLPPLASCVANPSAAGCSAVLPSLASCVANPAAAGCPAVLPTLAACVANPSAAGCGTVLPSLAQCSTTPSLAGCSAVLPTVAQCTLNPTAAGCSSVLPTLAQCTATPTLPGCTTALPPTDICTIAPNSALCQVLIPPVASQPTPNAPLTVALNQTVQLINTATQTPPPNFTPAPPSPSSPPPGGGTSGGSAKSDATGGNAPTSTNPGVSNEPVKKMYCN